MDTALPHMMKSPPSVASTVCHCSSQTYRWLEKAAVYCARFNHLKNQRTFPCGTSSRRDPSDWRETSSSQCGFRDRRLAVDVVGKLSYRTTCFGFVSTKPERRDAHQKSIFATRGPYSITATASRLTSVGGDTFVEEGAAVTPRLHRETYVREKRTCKQQPAPA